MKKLMFVAALAAVGSAFALESANVVGYNTLMHNEEGTCSPLFSFCFTPVNGAKFVKLGEFKPVDGTMLVEDDCIQVINPTTLGADQLFTYLDKTIADEIAIDEGGAAGDYDEFIGWWDEFVGLFEDGAKVDDYPVKAGFGFMGYFEACNEVTFQLPSSTAPLD